jgi:hypothetical protein
VTSTGAGGGTAGGTAGGGVGGGAGGGAGGGFGGGFGGGAGSYVETSITASCDDLSAATGATELLSPTTTPAISDDATTPALTIPLTVPFFGQLMGAYSVQTNGMVQLYTSTTSGTPSSDYMNIAIPTSAAPNGFAAPYWHDLFPVSTTYTSSVRSRVVTTGGSHLTISWENVSRSTSLTAPTRFQAKLFSSGVIEFHYCELSGSTATTGSGATIGLEDPSGLAGVTSVQTTVTSGTGIRFTP